MMHETNSLASGSLPFTLRVYTLRYNKETWYVDMHFQHKNTTNIYWPQPGEAEALLEMKSKNLLALKRQDSPRLFGYIWE